MGQRSVAHDERQGLMASTHSQLLSELVAQAQEEGVSMHELSRRSGVTYDTIRRAFIGQCDTTTKKFEMIAAALDMQPCLVPHKANTNEREEEEQLSKVSV